MFVSTMCMYRDVFMANSISEALSRPPAASASKLVAVVGMMHLDGIQNTLISRYGYKLVNIPTCPVESSTDSSRGSGPPRGYGTYDLPIIS